MHTLLQHISNQDTETKKSFAGVQNTNQPTTIIKIGVLWSRKKVDDQFSDLMNGFQQTGYTYQGDMNQGSFGNLWRTRHFREWHLFYEEPHFVHENQSFLLQQLRVKPVVYLFQDDNKWAAFICIFQTQFCFEKIRLSFFSIFIGMKPRFFNK